MSKEDLAAIANSTSPPEVQIPSSWQALIVWAVARFGAGILMAVVLGIATVQVYGDLTRLNERVLSAFEAQTRTTEANQNAMREMTQIMRQIEIDHRRHTGTHNDPR